MSAEALRCLSNIDFLQRFSSSNSMNMTAVPDNDYINLYKEYIFSNDKAKKRWKDTLTDQYGQKTTVKFDGMFLRNWSITSKEWRIVIPSSFLLGHDVISTSNLGELMMKPDNNGKFLKLFRALHNTEKHTRNHSIRIPKRKDGTLSM